MLRPAPAARDRADLCAPPEPARPRPQTDCDRRDGLWVAAALVFALYVHHTLGTPGALQYLAGYTLEESLSVDNLLVFLLLFRLFQIDHARQPRVLFWGVAGAIVMRGLFIAGGLKLLARFEWVTYVFGVILLVAAVRLFIPEKPGEQVLEPRWIAWLKRWHPISPRQDSSSSSKMHALRRRSFCSR